MFMYPLMLFNLCRSFTGQTRKLNLRELLGRLIVPKGYLELAVLRFKTDLLKVLHPLI